MSHLFLVDSGHVSIRAPGGEQFYDIGPLGPSWASCIGFGPHPYFSKPQKDFPRPFSQELCPPARWCFAWEVIQIFILYSGPLPSAPPLVPRPAPPPRAAPSPPPPLPPSPTPGQELCPLPGGAPRINETPPNYCHGHT